MNHSEQYSYDFSNKVAVVTGGASGIGFQTATKFIENGAKCAILDINDEKGTKAEKILNNEAKDTCKFFELNLKNIDEVEKCAYAVKKEFGKVNILVNSAGVIGKKEPLWEIEPTEWDHVVKNNLYGYFNVLKSFIPFIIKSQFGRIINVSSVSGKDGSINASSYSASKAGIIAMTKSLAKELSDFNIMVNCITPSATNTSLYQSESSEIKQRQIEKIPLGRACEPNEVANLIAWLASPLCSFTTGAVVDISGGRSTY